MMEPIITTNNNRYLKSLLSDIDREGLDERLTHALFHCFKRNPYGCRSEISIYTTKDIDIDDDKYVVVINVIDAVNHVMKFGVSGITLHYDGGEVFMSRELLIEKYELFEKYCSNSRLKQAHEMLFKL